MSMCVLPKRVTIANALLNALIKLPVHYIAVYADRSSLICRCLLLFPYFVICGCWCCNCSMGETLSGGSVRDRLTATTFFACLIVALSSWFIGGYTSALVNVPQNLIIQWIREIQCARITDHRPPLNDTQSDVVVWCSVVPANETFLHLRGNERLAAVWSMIGCAVMLGVSLGSLATNYLVEGLGLRRTLLLYNVLEILGSIAAGCSVTTRSYELFIIGRFIFGLGNGCVVLCGVYVAELSTNKHRGALNALATASFSAGMLVANIMGLPPILGNPDTWQHMCWIALLPSLLFIAAYHFLPESPRWLCRKTPDTGKLEKELQRLRGRQNVDADIRVLHQEVESARKLSSQKLSLLDVLRDEFLRKILGICLLAMFAQRFTGYSAVFVYSTEMFRQCGLTQALASYGTIILTAVCAVVALFSSPLQDMVGRRPMLLGGLVGCALCTAAMVIFTVLTKYAVCSACQYGTLLAMALFMVSYALGPASAPFLFTAEMFGMNSRQAASALGYLVNVALATLITAVFPVMQAYLIEWTFTIFTGITLILAVFLSRLLIETKGKSFLEIQKTLEDRFGAGAKASQEPALSQCSDLRKC
ncbi:solute carrier family 2, facilitated glucose transporter member 2-like [Paramacrobiotus metropolitanus]|uniref:solute carrier family 2, facilitated glucose transporter member 2-like n=1 Tax=Paramacrobiotus metropolitanus TaxID=2943436 RepID=UPI0024457AA8|nr:solute carrier family 2, facilitated glucose transporter member 2-like [Paramacrobiotus metropolitanus]